MQKQIIILRGTSNSGKSSFAELIAEPKKICCADFYFEKGGGYDFDPTKLGEAHQQCRDEFDVGCVSPFIKNIVIANTNAKPSDYQYYVDKAKEHDIKVTFVVLEKRHDGINSHNVPDFAIQRQHDSLINDLKLK